MHSSKLLPQKIKDSSNPKTKNHASALFSKEHAIDLIQEALHSKKDPAVTKHRNNFNAQQDYQSKRRSIPQLQKELQIAPNNKIYNTKNSLKRLEHFSQQSGNGLHQLKHSSNVQLNTANNNLLKIRPQSSNPQKCPFGLEMKRISNQKTKPELRPGSSKSSRLFRKKAVLVQDPIQSEGDELEDIFIKVNHKQKEETKAGTVRERQRIGTSISSKMRGMDKFETKLDPMFFNLFAS